MNRLTIASLICVLGAALCAQGQTPCEIVVRATVDAHGGHLSLADLIGRACPVVLASASSVPLGDLPLAGSVRVFEGDQVRGLLQRIVRGLPQASAPQTIITVPERISVRRAERLSCTEIGDRLFPGSHDIQCAIAGAIPREATLEMAQRLWDPATGTWEFVIRCTRSRDCVPFMVRAGNAEADLVGSPALRSQGQSQNARLPIPGREEVVVRRGESVRLVWEGEGIRAVVTAVCVDEGRQGDIVRARVVHTGQILRAVVMGPGRLRAQS